MGLFARLSGCLSTRTSTSVYFVSSTPFTVCFCICFAHELMCMWFGHSSFFSPHEHINFGISDAVTTHPPNVLHFWCIPVLFVYFYTPPLKKCGDFMVHLPFKNLR